MVALHEQCRLGRPGRPPRPRSARWPRHVDGPLRGRGRATPRRWRPATARHCSTPPSASPELDALLVAAEAADAAAAAHREAGRQSSARAAAARAALWLAACEGARPPTLLAAPEAAELTPREREIALLAAAGASSREIADRLVLSVRTVDNHLQNAYRKLGVTSRTELSGVLTGAPE